MTHRRPKYKHWGVLLPDISGTHTCTWWTIALITLKGMLKFLFLLQLNIPYPSTVQNRIDIGSILM